MATALPDNSGSGAPRMSFKMRAARWLHFIPLVRAMVETRTAQTPVKLRMWLLQKVLGENRAAYWPMHHSSTVSAPERILAGVDTCPGYMPGCYIQGRGGIIIGDYTQISANVGIISGNHDLYDTRLHVDSGAMPSVRIGAYGWIGMNATILPGVHLGDFTIVGAGAVVTKSFPEGYCVLVGNPARVVKTLERERCVRFQNAHEYYGYIPKHAFPAFRARHLQL